MTHNENRSQASQEFSEIIVDLHHIEEGREGLFSALFIDQKPIWRKRRYELVLQILKNKHKDLLEKYLGHIDHSPKENYIKLIHKIRKEALHTDELDPLLITFFTEISHQKFCNEIIALMKKSVRQDEITINSVKDFQDELQSTRDAIALAPHSLKIPLFAMICQFIKGQVSFHYDPYTQENTPYRQFEYNGTPALRMGTVTYEGYLAPLTRVASVTEEFQGFINAYKRAQKRHLYINLQNRNLGWFGYNEEPRCLAIEGFAKKYPDTLFVITLAKNTLFYAQDKQFVHKNNAKQFKADFLNEMKSLEGGFNFNSFPELLASDKILTSFMDKVHSTYFPNKEDLTLSERQDFIELVYLEIEKYCINTLAPHSFNISCKDGIDRAGGANALLYYESNPNDYQHLKSILFTPAILVKKRAITKERFDRFVSAASRIYLMRNKE